MRTYEDLTGQRFGKLVVEASVPPLKGQRRWLCRCDCGGTHVVTTGRLKSGHTTSCGCKKSPDLTGKVFGRLTVLGRSDKRSPRGARTTPLWECRCECGNITYKATDTLTNSEESMCRECKGRIGAEIAREHAGFVGGTQVSRIVNVNRTSSNTSGCRGVYLDRKTGKYRARLKFKGKIMSFGTFRTLEDAVAARKAAEELYFGEFLDEIGYRREEDGAV